MQIGLHVRTVVFAKRSMHRGVCYGVALRGHRIPTVRCCYGISINHFSVHAIIGVLSSLEQSLTKILSQTAFSV